MQKVDTSNLPLWDHQRVAIEKAKDLPSYALFFEMGVGKSRTTLEILKYKFNQGGRVLRTLIFAPPLVLPNWRQEWLMFTKINPKLVVPLYGSQVKRISTFNKATEITPGGLVFLTNYESLLMKDLFRVFQNWTPEVIVFDESHKLKSPSTTRSKKAHELANPWCFKTRKPINTPLKYLLTGTPVLNSPMDIFQQFKVMDGGDTFGGNYFAFRGRYFRDRNAGMPKDRYFPKWELMTKEKDGVNAEGELNLRIQSKSMRVTKAECLDLPPEVAVTIKVGLSPLQERLYQEMKRDFITFYNSKACVATLAITKALRLLQITSGYVSAWNPGEDEGPIEHSFESTPKRDALKDLLEEITGANHKVLVWAVFKNNYRTIREVCEELNLKYVEVHGEVSESKKRANVEQFKSDPETRVFLGHPGSGGIGLNLTVASYSIFYSRSFSLEQYLQARARNHRGGATEKVTHYDLIADGTIDELVLKALENKQTMSESLLANIAVELDRPEKN